MFSNCDTHRVRSLIWAPSLSISAAWSLTRFFSASVSFPIACSVVAGSPLCGFAGGANLVITKFKAINPTRMILKRYIQAESRSDPVPVFPARRSQHRRNHHRLPGAMDRAGPAGSVASPKKVVVPSARIIRIAAKLEKTITPSAHQNRCGKSLMMAIAVVTKAIIVGNKPETDTAPRATPNMAFSIAPALPGLVASPCSFIVCEVTVFE